MENLCLFNKTLSYIYAKFPDMILSSLEYSARIETLHPLFHTLFGYIKKQDLLHKEPGRIELDGENLFINNVEAELLPVGRQLLETHRRYIDVHIPLDGVETIGWKPAGKLRCEKQPYDPESDCALYNDVPDTWLKVRPGQFLIVYPEDAHAPVTGEGRLRKLIAKIKL